jgi:hypothetical protein
VRSSGYCDSKRATLPDRLDHRRKRENPFQNWHASLRVERAARVAGIEEVSNAQPKDPMWTLTARAELLRETLLYVTCLSDVDRVLLAQLLPALGHGV